jgi:endonuclease III
MSTKSRGDRIQLLVKAVTKHFSPVIAPSDRTVLEHLIYACCLEDAPYDAADEAFHRLQESFFDWNEVRVTTLTELMEHLQHLPNPRPAADRVKKNLQSIFETRYSFDLEDLRKINQGKAIAELEKLGGISRFVLAYVTQNALGGHAIPVSDNVMQVLLMTEIVTESEAAKGNTPGLDRSVPKTKGAEFASCLHQLGLMLAQSPNGKTTKTVLKEAGAKESKKPPSAPDKQSEAKDSGIAQSSQRAVANSDQKNASSKGPAAAKKAAPKKPTSPKKSPPKSGPKPPPAKKVAAKKADLKKESTKESTKKRKPR